MTEIEIESQTRNCAYAIWEAEGRPQGRAVDHWLAAEAAFQRPVPPRARASRVRTSPGMAKASAERPARSTTRRAKAAAATGPKR